MVHKGDVFVDNRPESLLIWIHVAAKDASDGYVDGPQLCIVKDTGELYSIQANGTGREGLKLLGNVYAAEKVSA